MLVLSRRPQQSLLIGHDVVVTVLEVNGDTVRIGIKAPSDVDIHREEIYHDLQKANADSAVKPGSAAALAKRIHAASPRGTGADGPTSGGCASPPPDQA
ncbi:carbon storage regulator CsrA [Agilicoccus flavus]|uniref:carbon storage regulator CsrA n=1 Tax=Agilicoccus flavus TaxID=2775968 RepID=UPI0027DA728D|nr:carbon storage regulator CsrA [Agilicoccus flavus]